MTDPFDAAEYLMHPSRWPRWARRAFLLGFPITVPVWAALCLVAALLGVIGVVVLLIALWMYEMWTGNFG